MWRDDVNVQDFTVKRIGTHIQFKVTANKYLSEVQMAEATSERGYDPQKNGPLFDKFHDHYEDGKTFISKWKCFI